MQELLPVKNACLPRGASPWRAPVDADGLAVLVHGVLPGEDGSPHPVLSLRPPSFRLPAPLLLLFASPSPSLPLASHLPDFVLQFLHGLAVSYTHLTLPTKA